MTPKEVADATGYSKPQINYLIRTGKVAAIKLPLPGGQFVYEVHPSEVQRLKKIGKDNRGWNSVNKKKRLKKKRRPARRRYGQP